VLFTGAIQGTVDLGGGPLAPANSSSRPFLLKLDADGHFIYAKQFGDSASSAGFGDHVAVDADDNVILTGGMVGNPDFGGGPVATGGVFVVKFDPQGQHVFSKGLGNPSTTLYAQGLGAGPAGEVILAFSMWGATDFGGAVLQTAGNDDVVLVKWGPLGQHVWSQVFGDSDPQNVWDASVDADGRIAITGSFESGIDFGGRALVSSGSSDIFLALFDTDGQHLASRRFGDAQFQSATQVTSDPAGNVSIVGTMLGTVDFGGGPLTDQGVGDVYVARFDSSLRHLCSRRFGDSAAQSAGGIAANGSALAFAGTNDGTVDLSALGGGLLPSSGKAHAFVAVFQP
jgi:hypothetical protein